MKKTPYLLLIILIFSCKENIKSPVENSKNKYSINGTIENLKDSLTIVLSNIDWRNRSSNDIDSTYSIAGKFNFKGNLPNPGLHTLIIKDYKNMIGKAVNFWFANEEIIINGNYDDFENSTIIGSPSNELYKKYLKLEPKDKLDFIYKNPDNNFSLSTLMDNPEWISKDSLKLFYSKLNTELKNSKKGITLNNIITTESIKIGDHFKDFEALDLKGNKVKLSDFKGKVILIDFWAIWCHFCHEQNQTEFTYLNKKYNKDEFVIISYSLDTKKELWEKSSKADSIDWINISNIKGMNDPIVALFDLKSLPQSFLIDKNGIIVKTFNGYNSENNIIEQEIDKLINK
ncbi:TlpA disulfide reductase family protein [Lutibacter sp.]|uniref:TlpA disulfide reductase family protein n=1 Tax=Lutibacter sp. TaxID=1925666 RepID=UPI001A27DE10|nr:TlpA disulfide reductase family protein [Lutibacter sp.]MBI9042757.1 AhpC/TSA family protein [Lutibacter sp.]